MYILASDRLPASAMLVELLVLIASFCHANEVQGKCQSLTPIKDFDPVKISGDWYLQEITKTGSELRCVKYVFDTNNSTNSTMNFSANVPALNSTISAKMGVQFANTSRGTTVILNLNGSKSNRYILGTDYSSYFVFYSCEYLSIIATTEILTRDARPKASVIKAAYTAIVASLVEKHQMVKVDQENCQQIKRGSVESSFKPDGASKLLTMMLQNKSFYNPEC